MLLGKVVHFSLLLLVPSMLHGFSATLFGAACYSVSLSIVLAVVFFVSHNVPENKPNLPGAEETKKVGRMLPQGVLHAGLINTPAGNWHCSLVEPATPSKQSPSCVMQMPAAPSFFGLQMLLTCLCLSVPAAAAVAGAVLSPA